MIRRIEVDFAIPVELTDREMQQLCAIVNNAARRTETAEIVHWRAGCGSKPHFSQADALFLGKEADADAPESGEPTWDNEVFYVETHSRERYDTEPLKPISDTSGEGRLSGMCMDGEHAECRRDFSWTDRSGAQEFHCQCVCHVRAARPTETT